MLKPGDLLRCETSDWIGLVLRYDGDEGCIIRRPNGKEERWNKYTDEIGAVDPTVASFYRSEVHTVADMIDALRCLPQDAHVSIVDGDHQGCALLRLHKDAAHGEGGPWDVVSIEAAL